ncbi:hypothetical protein BU16DRAFT_148367 [Lophium mytilinum]|uniref:Uncharacterized protein n=1 Tax=Lophium mytilinum TaxID=390894 RepID=A0A6A6QE58_9PEZI|nr:hypothetical protein BU16DRAFT_148367 [Lophium mytilinum]
MPLGKDTKMAVSPRRNLPKVKQPMSEPNKAAREGNLPKVKQPMSETDPSTIRRTSPLRTRVPMAKPVRPGPIVAAVEDRRAGPLFGSSCATRRKRRTTDWLGAGKHQTRTRKIYCSTRLSGMQGGKRRRRMESRRLVLGLAS